MTRIEKILIRVRDSLSDEDESRWLTDRLIRLIDEAQIKVATKAKLLRSYVHVSILANINEYTLPTDAFLLTRVVNSDGGSLPIKSHSNVDDELETRADHNNSRSYTRTNFTNFDADWEFEVGPKVEAIIFDNQNPRKFKAYPIVEEVDGGEVFVISDYGVVTTVEGDVMSSDFGIVVDVTTTGLLSKQFNSVYGIVTYMASIEETLKVYYRARPAEVTLVSDLLEIDEKWDAAIKHYVVGMALRDDQDTQNRTTGLDELKLFDNEFQEAKAISSKDNTSRANSRTSYNPGI